MINKHNWAAAPIPGMHTIEGAMNLSYLLFTIAPNLVMLWGFRLSPRLAKPAIQFLLAFCGSALRGWNT